MARTAGPIAASSVIPIPIPSATAIVRVSRTRLDVGIPAPTALNNAPIPLAKASPPNRPATEASTPMVSASTATERRTWDRVAPSVRSEANSRVRSATEIEKVLKMMKAPTSSAAPAKASSAGPRKELIEFEISLACSSACCCPVCTLTSGGATDWMTRTS